MCHLEDPPIKAMIALTRCRGKKVNIPAFRVWREGGEGLEIPARSPSRSKPFRFGAVLIVSFDRLRKIRERKKKERKKEKKPHEKRNAARAGPAER